MTYLLHFNCILCKFQKVSPKTLHKQNDDTRIRLVEDEELNLDCGLNDMLCPLLGVRIGRNQHFRLLAVLDCEFIQLCLILF